MIRRVWFEEFRALRKVEVPLERLTVLVGPNSSGKTSILDGIRLLLDGFRGFPDSVLSKRWLLDRARGAVADRSTVLGAEFEGTSPPDQIVVSYREEDRPGLPPKAVVGSVHVRCKGIERDAKDDLSFGHLGNLGEPFSSFAAALPTARHLRLEASKLAAVSYSTDEVPVLGEDGEGLASVIADLATRSPDALARIVESVRDVVPNVQRVRAVRAQLERIEWDSIVVNEQRVNVPRSRAYWGHRVVVDMTSGAEIPLSSAGEGTALAIGLMTFLHTASSVGVLLLDDLDRALHPKAQQDLVRVVRGVLQQRPGVQVVATTHSPFILNELEYPEVRLTTLSDDGATIVGSLTDHPDYERWKDHVKPGELWTSELEDWLKGAHAEAAE